MDFIQKPLFSGAFSRFFLIYPQAFKLSTGRFFLFLYFILPVLGRFFVINIKALQGYKGTNLWSSGLIKVQIYGQ